MASVGVFSNELMKLRRRIGDTYTPAGVLLDNTAGATTDVRLIDGTLLTAPEIIDIYNNAVNNYLGYLVANKPKAEWASYATGYVVLLTNQTPDNVAYVKLSSLTPVPFKIIDIARTTPTTMADLYLEVSPTEYMADAVGVTKVRKNINKFTVTWSGTFWVANLSPALTATTVHLDIMFLARHTDLTSATTTGFDTAFAPQALQDILTFAEVECRRALSQDIKDSPEARLQALTGGTK